MITADELRGEVFVGGLLRGERRRVDMGANVYVPGSRIQGRKRAKSFSARSPEHHRQYVRCYDAARRPEANARVAKYTERHPERRKLQLRAAARRYWRRKRAILVFFVMVTMLGREVPQ